MFVHFNFTSTSLHLNCKFIFMQTIFVLSEFRVFLFDIKSSNKFVPVLNDSKVGEWDFIVF